MYRWQWISAVSCFILNMAEGAGEIVNVGSLAAEQQRPVGVVDERS